MKNIVTIILSIITPLVAFGQYPMTNASSYKLKFGDRLPNLNFKHTIDYKGRILSQLNGANSFSDLRGKLVILDFWTTTCSTCIENFPHMEELQREFGDKIQVILVNTFESEQKVSEWINKRNAKTPGKFIIPPNLPILISKEIGEYFPIINEIGYHVWLGRDGKYILRGISENSHSKKVNEYLSGKNIEFLPDGKRTSMASRPFFDSVRPGPELASMVAPFTIEYYAYGNQFTGIIDSVAQTIRATFVNTRLLELLRYANSYKIDAQSNILNRRSDYIINIKDTTLVTNDPRILGHSATDESYRKSSYTYEVVAPIGYKDSIIRDKMISDLNFYTNEKLGLSTNVVPTKLTCYKLVLDEDQVKKVKSDRKSTLRYDSSGVNNEKFTIFDGYTFDEVFFEYFNMGKTKYKDIILGETSYRGRLRIALPAPQSQDADIHRLSNILKKQGFNFNKGEEFINTLVIEYKKSYRR